MRRLLVALFFAGCASIKPTDPASILEVPVEQVAGCRSLGLLAADGTTPSAVRTQALEQAGRLGATHVVWTETWTSPKENRASLKGSAYRCK